MRIKLKRSILISIMFLFMLLLLPGYRAEAASVKVKLNKTAITLYTKGTKTTKLKATVTGSKKKVKWSISNKKVATVNSSGKVTAKKAGTATITAKVAGKSAKCKVTVKKSKKTPSIVKTKKINWYKYYYGTGPLWIEEISLPLKNLTYPDEIKSVKVSSGSAFKVYNWINIIDDNEELSALLVTISSKKDASTLKPTETVNLLVEAKQDGKVYKLKCKLNMKRYPNIIKSLKVGSEEYASYFKNGVGLVNFDESSAPSKVPSKGKGKVSVKLASGYKLTKLKVWLKPHSSKEKTIKNNSTPSKDGIYGVSIQCKKDGITFYYSLRWPANNNEG